MVSRRKLAAGLGLLAVSGLGAVALVPAHASTVANVTLTSTGSLSIAEPVGTTAAPVNLGSTTSGYSAWTSGGLGTVTVTDSRTGLLANNWTATAAATAFNYVGTPPSGATTAQTSIPVTSIVYNTGTGTAGTGGATAPVFAAVGGSLSTGSVTAGTMAAVGTNSESWNPTFTITLANQLAGTYQGTITHSVA